MFDNLTHKHAEKKASVISLLNLSLLSLNTSQNVPLLVSNVLKHRKSLLIVLVATKTSNLLITTSKLILDHLQLFLFVPEINKILGGYLS